MRLAIFCYDFPTSKTNDHWMHLLAHGWRPELVLAAPRVDLGYPAQLLRQSPQGRILSDPRYLSELSGAQYEVVRHNSPECADLLRLHQIDIGLILGARILCKQTIESCSIGIVNLHPGWLPHVRGLDTIKWPLLRELPLGVTAHLIDENIDRGRLIYRQMVERLTGDTLMDIQLRIWDVERQLMIDSLTALQRNPDTSMLVHLGQGEYFGQMPVEIERLLCQQNPNQSDTSHSSPPTAEILSGCG